MRDLTDVAVKLNREREMEKVRRRAEDAAEERILDILLRPARAGVASVGGGRRGRPTESASTRQKFRKMLREGKLDEREIEIELSMPAIGVEIMAPPGMEEMTSQLQSMFQNLGGGKTRTRRLRIRDAFRLLTEEEAGKLINEDDLKSSAVEDVEQNGIVFLDEIDKVSRRSDRVGADVSREGVQRDLLPLVEGSTVSTKYGAVRTDHILFIASGAFHTAKPSDLIPGAPGPVPDPGGARRAGSRRLPAHPHRAGLLAHRAVRRVARRRAGGLSFTAQGLRRIAEIAWQVNESTENIGARRLHTVLERLLETLSFESADMAGTAAWRSTPSTWIRILRSSRRTRICRVTFSSEAAPRTDEASPKLGSTAKMTASRGIQVAGSAPAAVIRCTTGRNPAQRRVMPVAREHS